MDYELPADDNGKANEKQICRNCGNDTFWLYMKNSMADASLYCTKCGECFS